MPTRCFSPAAPSHACRSTSRWLSGFQCVSRSTTSSRTRLWLPKLDWWDSLVDLDWASPRRPVLSQYGAACSWPGFRFPFLYIQCQVFSVGINFYGTWSHCLLHELTAVCSSISSCLVKGQFTKMRWDIFESVLWQNTHKPQHLSAFRASIVKSEFGSCSD